VAGKRPALKIHFAFSGINAAEISKNELAGKLLSAGITS
jgi:hypothetical protein